jgi:hypothetical protein
VTKRLFTLSTGAWDWTGPKNIFILQGPGFNVPFTLEKIDVYWEAVKGSQLDDTLYFNWRYRDDWPDSPYLVEPPNQPSILTNEILSPLMSKCRAMYASADYGIPVPEDGPLCWSPSPGDSKHTFDLMQLGGLTADWTANDGAGSCLHLAFKHNLEYYVNSYRMVLTIIEDT